MTRQILVTGASGFLGSAVVGRLVADGWAARAATHLSESHFPNTVARFHGAALDGSYNWGPALEGCDVVVHTAARVHQMRDASADPLEAYRKTNVAGTLRLAREAANAGVRRFVFLSSIKVNGELTRGTPFRSNDPPAPVDAYGISKLEAETGLRRLAAETGIEVVVIRPVLVYGPGVRANFASLMRWLARGIPLPFGSVKNQRSLVGLQNVVDLVSTCTHHPSAANEVFLVSDGEDLSTPDLLRRTGNALGRPARLVPVPPRLLRATAGIVGGIGVRRLIDSLQVDITHTRQRLGWSPPMSVDDGLRAAARWFLSQARGNA